MERGVKRPLVDLQDVLRDLLDPLRNGPSMHGLRLERSKNQEVKRALRDVGRRLSRHWCRVTTLTLLDVECQHHSSAFPTRVSATPVRTAAAPAILLRVNCSPRKTTAVSIATIGMRFE